MKSARAAHLQGRHAEAQGDFVTALRIAETFTPVDVRLGQTLADLAKNPSCLGKWDDAEQVALRALAVIEKSVGLDAPVLAQALTTLGELYQLRGKCNQAEPLFQRALLAYEKSLGPNDPLVADVLTALGHLYHLQGRDAEAEPLLRGRQGARTRSR